MNKRLKDKNLEGNLTGEGMVSFYLFNPMMQLLESSNFVPFLNVSQIQGGIIIFDKEGKVRYAYEEEIGTPLDINDLVSALEKIRDE